MIKKTAVSVLYGFLIGFLLFGGFQSYLQAGSKHVVDTGELREAIIASSQVRSANIEKLERQLSQWGFDATQVKTVARTLTDVELEYLLSRTENTGQNLSGGGEVLGDAGDTVGLIVLVSVAGFIAAWQLFKLTAGSGVGSGYY